MKIYVNGGPATEEEYREQGTWIAVNRDQAQRQEFWTVTLWTLDHEKPGIEADGDLLAAFYTCERDALRWAHQYRLSLALVIALADG